MPAKATEALGKGTELLNAHEHRFLHNVIWTVWPGIIALLGLGLLQTQLFLSN
jgi:hypothetical protein